MSDIAAAAKSTVDPREVAQFSALAATWWDENGPFRPLHRMNPVRVGYVKARLCAHFGREPHLVRPFEGLRVLDIGCGGGLLSEPLARLGASVVGADASEKNIGTARAHAQAMRLDIDYRHATAEDLAAAGEQFDAVLNLEVIEHVADMPSFLAACAQLIRPGGAMVLSTLNRTAKSWMMAIAGAEYVLRWLPRGTHDWHKFLTPADLARAVRAAGLQVADLTGFTFHPLSGEWSRGSDVSVNYAMFVTREGAGVSI